MKTRIVLFLALAVVAAQSFVVNAQPWRRPGGDRDRDRDEKAGVESRYRGYEHLGSRKVELERNKDTVEVGSSEGRFRAILIEVEDSSLNMHNIKLTFGDGTTYSPETRLRFNEDTRSRAIDLPGDARVIKKVDFTYDSRWRGRATVNLYGRTESPHAGYDLVGTCRSEGRESSARLDVADSDTRYRSLAIEVPRGTIEIDEVTVTFANDETFASSDRMRFDDDNRSFVIDLPGRARAIERIDFDLRGGRRAARVTINVYGKAIIPPERRFPGYKFLGTAEETLGSGRASIAVNADAGKLTRVIVEVEDVDLELSEVKFRFASSDLKWSVELRRQLKEGERSRHIDLPGEGCKIEGVDVHFRAARDRAREKATINVYGKSAWSWERDVKSPRDRFEGHTFLGSRRVDFGGDKDSIEVGRDEGEFRGIMIEVEDGEIELYDLDIEFTNGNSHSPETRLHFKDDTRTRNIDLPGGGRNIAYVSFKYRSTKGSEGRATINLYGKK